MERLGFWESTGTVNIIITVPAEKEEVIQSAAVRLAGPHAVSVSQPRRLSVFGNILVAALGFLGIVLVGLGAGTLAILGAVLVVLAVFLQVLEPASRKSMR